MYHCAEITKALEERQGTFLIKIDGKVDGEKLTPRNFDVREVREVTALAEDLLFGSDKKNRPRLTYDLEEGSAKNVFMTVMTIIVSAGAQLRQVAETGSLAGIDPVRARAVERVQEIARQKEWAWELGTETMAKPLKVNTETFYQVMEDRRWYETEFYFYGLLRTAGGARANIHLVTADFGTLTIPVSPKYLENLEDNVLMKICAVRAIGRQDALTGDVDYASLKVQEIKRHGRFFDAGYIDRLTKQATDNWLGKLEDPDAWLRNIRGYDE